MGGQTMVMVPATAQERAMAAHLITAARGLGRELEFGRAVEIARLVVEEEDEEVPNVRWWQAVLIAAAIVFIGIWPEWP